MKNLVIMCGLPRSGKSTYIDKYYSEYQIVCADDIREALGVQFNPAIEDHVWAIHHTMVRAHLKRGINNVVLDSTNCVIDRFLKWQRECDLHAYRMTVLHMDTPMEICLKRNHGKGSVPDAVIRRMALQLQQLKQNPKFEMFDIITIKPEDYEL